MKILNYFNLFLILIFFVNFINSEEELCSLNPEEMTPSCSANIEKEEAEKDDGLTIEDEIKLEGSKEKKSLTENLNSFESNNITKPDPEYLDLFRRQGHERKEFIDSFTQGSEFTDYYDFSIDEEEIMQITTQKMAVFPPKRFQHNNQGNFLHFYRIAYEKKLPVYFTIDSMLYAFNENVNRIKDIFLQDVFYELFKNFLEKLITFAQEYKETDGQDSSLHISHAQIYYGVGLKFLIDGIDTFEADGDIEPGLKGMFGLAKFYGSNDFYILLKKRKLDTSALLPVGFWRSSRKLANIYQAVKWFNLVRLDLSQEMSSIWILGKLIHESGLGKLYENLHETYHYIMGEDRLVPNVYEIYQLGSKQLNYNDWMLIPEQEKELYTLIKAQRENYFPDLGFTVDFFLFTKETFERFKYEREETSYVFNYQYDVEEWFINKMINPRPDSLRLVVSSYELTEGIHHASAYKQIIHNRFKGVESFTGDELIQFRDGVDMLDNYEKAKYSIKDSMNKYPENWRKNLLNNYHLLLYRATRFIKSDDPLFKDPSYKEKYFHTAYASIIHFKREINIYTKEIDIKLVDGDLTEVILEPNLLVYDEMQEMLEIFSDKTKESFKIYHSLNLKNSSETTINKIFQELNTAIDICKQGIKMQESGTLTDEMKEKLRKLIYKNEKTNFWDGWYAKLFYKNNHKNLFNYDIWVSKTYGLKDIEHHKFPGALIYTTMNFPYIGFTVKYDKQTQTEKMALYATYAGKEFYKKYDPKVTFEDIAQKAVLRE